MKTKTEIQEMLHKLKLHKKEERKRIQKEKAKSTMNLRTVMRAKHTLDILEAKRSALAWVIS